MFVIPPPPVSDFSPLVPSPIQPKSARTHLLPLPPLSPKVGFFRPPPQFALHLLGYAQRSVPPNIGPPHFLTLQCFFCAFCHFLSPLLDMVHLLCLFRTHATPPPTHPPPPKTRPISHRNPTPFLLTPPHPVPPLFTPPPHSPPPPPLSPRSPPPFPYCHYTARTCDALILSPTFWIVPTSSPHQPSSPLSPHRCQILRPPPPLPFCKPFLLPPYGILAAKSPGIRQEVEYLYASPPHPPLSPRRPTTHSAIL